MLRSIGSIFLRGKFPRVLNCILSSLQVLFDTLKYHGASFTAPFWARVFDSVLLPIFDHVRAEVGILHITKYSQDLIPIVGE